MPRTNIIRKMGRKFRSVSQLWQGEEEGEASEPPPPPQARGKGKGRRRAPRPPSPPPVQEDDDDEEEEEAEVEAEDVDLSASQHADPSASDHAEGTSQSTGGDSSSCAQRRPYSRGPSRLPSRLPTEDQKPTIRPILPRSFVVTANSIRGRLPNGILGILVKKHYPGTIIIDGEEHAVTSFKEYVDFEDNYDDNGIKYSNKAVRVVKELQNYFKIEEGFETLADEVALNACFKLVSDMWYEARGQAVRTWYTTYEKRRLDKEEWKTKNLTKEQYMQVIPEWCLAHRRAWEIQVDKWVDINYEEVHNEYRDRRAMMPGPAHHQGNLNLPTYQARYEEVHGVQISTLEAFANAHIGKYKDPAVVFNPEAGPEAYSNRTAYEKITRYTEVARETYGESFDPRGHDIEGDIAMIAGGGKKHGRYYLGDSVINPHQTKKLSELRRRSGGPVIRERPTTYQATVARLEAQLEEERRRSEAAEERERARDRAEQERARLEQERAEQHQKSMEALLAYLGRIGGQIGMQLPEGITFPPPPPPVYVPPPPPVYGQPAVHPPPPGASPGVSHASNPSPNPNNWELGAQQQADWGAWL